MIAFFLLTIGVMVADGYLDDFSIGYIIVTFWAIFSSLGVLFLVLTLKQKTVGALRFFLLLTGSSATGFTVFVLLHNIVSGLFNIEEPVFFVLATIICPLGFLAGVIGTIVLSIRNKPNTTTETS
jgi:hypothetical protein